MQLPKGKTRLDMDREGLADVAAGGKKRGRLIVGVNKLREDPRNERKTFRNMDGLIASINAVGLVEPITVMPDTDDTYRIITGHRRYRAAKAAGLEQVEVLIREPEDERTRRQKSVISNVQREDVGPVEMAEALQAMIDEDERIKEQDDLARIIGKDKQWVSGMLRVLTLPAPLQRKVGSAQLNVSYDAMIRIARLDDAKHQEELVALLLGGAGRTKIRDRIDEIKGKVKLKANAAPTAADVKPKPKRVYRTKYDAIVIVQSLTEKLTGDQCMEALQEALGKAATGTVDSGE
jgi:ParB/RepB/Spo0J family partition protein